MNALCVGPDQEVSFGRQKAPTMIPELLTMSITEVGKITLFISKQYDRRRMFVRSVRDQLAVAGKLDRLADIDAGRPARLVGRGIVAAIHDVEPVGRAGLRQRRQPERHGGREAENRCLHVSF